jgi:hypothetical protein
MGAFFAAGWGFTSHPEPHLVVRKAALHRYASARRPLSTRSQIHLRAESCWTPDPRSQSWVGFGLFAHVGVPGRDVSGYKLRSTFVVDLKQYNALEQLLLSNLCCYCVMYFLRVKFLQERTVSYVVSPHYNCLTSIDTHHILNALKRTGIHSILS